MKKKITISILAVLALVVIVSAVITISNNDKSKSVKGNEKFKTVKLPRKTNLEELEVYTEWNYKNDDIEITVYKNGSYQDNTILIRNKQEQYICPLYKTFTGKVDEEDLPTEIEKKMYKEKIVFDNPANSVNAYIYANENSMGMTFIDKDERLGSETEIELDREKDSIPKLAVTSYLRSRDKEDCESNYLSETYYWEQISGGSQEGEVKVYGDSLEEKKMDCEWVETYSVKKENEIYAVYFNNEKVYEYRNELLPVTTVQLGEIAKNDINSSDDVFLLAMKSYIEYCGSDNKTELNKVKDIEYTHTLGNDKLGTVKVYGNITNEEKFSKDYEIKKEQKAYQIIDGEQTIYEYILDASYIHKIIQDYFVNVKKKEIQGKLSYQYDMSKKAEKITLMYENSGDAFEEIYYVKVYEDLGMTILYNEDYQPVYTQNE